MAKRIKKALYERQEGETLKAFEAFQVYRDLGADRSISKVVQKLNKSQALIGRWSSQNNWVERVQSYDEEMDRKALIQDEKDRKTMWKRHANTSMMLQQKVLERIRSLNPDELSTSDLIRWFETAVKIERLSRGESTDITSLEHGGEVTQKHEHSLEEDIEKYAEMYDRIRNKKA